TAACMRSGLAPRSVAIVGRAVFRMVPSSICMKKATATTQRSMGAVGAGGVKGAVSKVVSGIDQPRFFIS
ncbi:MAG: hypothetical protein FWH34_09020, partial [Desulfovibrionaceae bacterium]|nr:hypothetical protein [Desulfovibrionaceae bacterium]